MCAEIPEATPAGWSRASTRTEASDIAAEHAPGSPSKDLAELRAILDFHTDQAREIRSSSDPASIWLCRPIREERSPLVTCGFA